MHCLDVSGAAVSQGEGSAAHAASVRFSSSVGLPVPPVNKKIFK